MGCFYKDVQKYRREILFGLIAAIIFVLPMLIEFLFEVLGIYSATTCGIN